MLSSATIASDVSGADLTTVGMAVFETGLSFIGT